MNQGAAEAIAREIEGCIGAVLDDAGVGTGGEGDDRVAERLEVLADQAAAADLGDAPPVPSEAVTFPVERPRRASMRDADADAFMATLSTATHARLATDESALLAAHRARSTTSGLRVAAAARVAASVLRARLARWDLAIGRDAPTRLSGLERVFEGAELPSLLRQHPSYRARGLLCSALEALRNAASGSRVRIDVAHPRRAEAIPEARAVGPYRLQPLEEPAMPPDVEIELAIAARAEDSGLEYLRRVLLGHAEMLVVIRRLRCVTRSPLGRLAFWSNRAVEDLDVRARWHRAMALTTLDGAVVVVARARRGVFACDLRQALIQAELALRAIGHDDRALTSKSDAMRAMSRLRSVLVRAWGDPGDRAQLALDVLAHLETHPSTPSPIAGDRVRRRLERGELVVLVAEALRATTFLDDHRRRKKVPGAFDRRNELFEGALWRYAPAALIHRLDSMVSQAGAAELGGDEWLDVARSSARMGGRRAALASFIEWAVVVREKFGWMPSDGELLARHWGRMLAPVIAARGPALPRI